MEVRGFKDRNSRNCNERLLTGIDGHGVKLIESVEVIQMNNRNRPLWNKENDSGEIIAPLEQP